jgi:hypothetical protein
VPEIEPPKQLKCDGCGRYFDSDADLARTQIGANQNSFCRRCFSSATGPGWGRTFDEQRAHAAL